VLALHKEGKVEVAAAVSLGSDDILISSEGTQMEVVDGTEFYKELWSWQLGQWKEEASYRKSKLERSRS